MTTDLQPGHFVPEPGRQLIGPYAECLACSAWFKDHVNGKCPPPYTQPEVLLP